MDIDFVEDKDIISKEKIKAYEDIMLLLQTCEEVLYPRETFDVLIKFLKYVTRKNKAKIKDGTQEQSDLLWEIRHHLVTLKNQSTGNNKIRQTLIEIINTYDKRLKRQEKEEKQYNRKRNRDTSLIYKLGEYW